MIYIFSLTAFIAGMIFSFIIFKLKFKNLQDKFNLVNNDLLKNNSELDNIKKLHTELLIQAERFKTQLLDYESIKNELTNLNKLVNDIQNENSGLKVKISSLNDNLLEKQAFIQQKDADYKNLFINYENKNQENTLSKEKISELNTRIEKDQQAFQEKLALLNNSEQKLKESFENLANQILDSKTKTFNLKQNEQLDQVLKPLKEQLESFRNRVESVHSENKTGQELLKQTIDDLKKINNQISFDAQNLTKALKHDTKTQGSWGELILESILENSGLREGYEFETQKGFKDENGKTQKPDVIVKLPNNKHIIVDSKMSLTAYERYINLLDESEKQKALTEHISSVKKHIKELSDKHYENLHKDKSLDFVLLFIPIESAFLTAIEKEKSLFSDAFDKMIVIVCPSTLMTTLKTIHSLWNYEYRNQNVFKIADEAGKMYNKFVDFIEDLESIGKYLKNLNKSYEDAFNKLSSGTGNLISRAEKLRLLGAKNKKKFSLELIEKAESDNLDFSEQNNLLPELNEDDNA